MKEVFEKIIERLEDRKQLHNRMIDYENKNGTVSEEFQQRKAVEALDYAIKIVNQVAAEYNKSLMEELIEAKNNCGEDSDCSGCIFEQLPDRCYLQELQIRNNNGWIPCSERFPSKEEFKKAYCRNRYGAEFIVMIEGANRPTTLYLTSNGLWVDDRRNVHGVVAWQPLPESYNQNACQDANCPYNDGNECHAADGCAGYERKRTNFDRCCESMESMAQIIDIAKIGWTKEQIMEWLKKEECELPE